MIIMLIVSFVFGSTPSLILAANQDIFVLEEVSAVEDAVELVPISTDEVVEPMPVPEDEVSEILDETVAEDAEVNVEEDEILETPATDLVEDVVVPACVEVLMCEDAPQTVAPKNEGTTQSLRRSLPLSSGDFKQKEKQAEQSFVPGEVLVRFKEKMIDLTTDAGLAAATAFVEANGLTITSTITASNIAVVGVPDGEEAATIARLKYQPDVLHVQLNYTRKAETTDENFELLWALNNIGQLVEGLNNVEGTNDADIDAPEAWTKSEGGSVIVAVIDSGVAFNHPDLLANMWDGTGCVDEDGSALGGCQHGYDFADDDPQPLPTTSSHGTHVAGTIAAVSNTIGVVGVAHGAKIMALKVSSHFPTDEILRAVKFAEANGATIVNGSYGGPAFDIDEQRALEEFSGVLVISAGNRGNNHATNPFYPCAYELPNIICVAATDQNDGLAVFVGGGASDYGAVSVDVGAPGTNILSTVAAALLENFSDAAASEFTAEGNWGISSAFLRSDVNNEPYAPNADASFTSPVVDLSKNNAATLKFIAVCDTEYDLDFWTDYVAVEMSGNGGSSYSEIERFDEATLEVLGFLKSGDLSDLDGGVGLSPVVTLALPIASDLLTDASRFRFRWVTDDSVTGSIGFGCVVDDVELIGGDGTANLYDYSQGTSMAAPHVAGVAALVKGYNTNIAISKLKEIILDTGNELDDLVGNTVSGKRVNAANALNVFAPRVGRTADDVVESQEGPPGDHVQKINFSVRDGIAGLPITLKQFEYSVDGGATWQAPTNGDATLAMSAAQSPGDWRDNNYLTVTEFPEVATGTIIFDVAHDDLAGLVGVDQDDVRVHFQANDGAVDSPFAVSNAFSVDLLAPTAVLSNTPAALTNATSATITIGGDDVVSYGYALDGDAFTVIVFPVAEPLALSGLVEGVHTLRVIAKDDAENEQATANATTFTWTVDTTPGTALLTSKPDARTNQTTATIVIGGEDVATYTYVLDEGESQGPFPTSDAIELIGLAEGSHTIAVTGIDALGNVQSSATDYTWIIDTTSPILTLSGFPSNPGIPSDPTNITSATVVVGGTDVVAYRFSLDGGVFGRGTPVATPITLIDLTDGIHTIAVIARDDVGNWQDEADAITASWTVDTLAPTLAEVTPVATPTNNATPTVVVTVEFGANWEILRGEIVLASGVGTGAEQSVELPTLTDGIYELTLTAEDAAGNSASITFEAFVIDTASPTGLSLGGVPASPTNITAATITLNAGSDVVLYRASVDGSAFGSETPVTTPITITGLADGTHTVAVIARDEVGNWMPESGAITATWVVDTLSPVVAFGNLPQSPTSSSRVEIIVGGEGVVVYRVSVDGGVFGPITPVATPVTLTDLTEGTHTVTAIGSDAALNWQNENAATTFTFVYTIARGGGRALGGGLFTPLTPAPAVVPVVLVAPTTRTLVPQVLGVRVFAEGILIRVDGRSIYVVRGRTLHRIPDLGTLQRFADRTRIEVASEDIVGYAIGSLISKNLPTHTARTLLRVNAKAIYVVNGSTLHRVPDVRSLWPYRDYTRVEVTENELIEFQVGDPVATL